MRTAKGHEKNVVLADFSTYLLRIMSRARNGISGSKSLRNIYLCILVFGLTLAHSSKLIAQSYAAGQARYMKNDFKGAEQSLEKALTKEKRTPERAKIFKLLGIVQYMQANKPSASKSFKQALALDPRLTVTEDEALDESVIPFFNQNKAPATAAAPVAKTPAATARSAPPPHRRW